MKNYKIALIRSKNKNCKAVMINSQTIKQSIASDFNKWNIDDCDYNSLYFGIIKPMHITGFSPIIQSIFYDQFKNKKYRFRISNKRKIDDFIKWTLTWCQGLKLEEWEEKHENDKVKYLHGYCDKWVLKNYQDGDIPVIWNEFNEELGKVCLIHCYIIRNGKYIDVRGETENIEDIKEGFDYWPDNNDYQCKNLKEYKNMIRKICHCKKKKWNRSRMKKLFC